MARAMPRAPSPATTIFEASPGWFQFFSASPIQVSGAVGLPSISRCEARSMTRASCTTESRVPGVVPQRRAQRHAVKLGDRAAVGPIGIAGVLQAPSHIHRRAAPGHGLIEVAPQRAGHFAGDVSLLSRVDIGENLARSSRGAAIDL